MILFLLVLLNSFFLRADVCLLPGLKVDQTCSCAPNCDQFFDPQYKQALKASRISPTMMKAMLENQKHTAKAYNKIVSNQTLTAAELALVEKEEKILAKINANEIKKLQLSMAKQGKKLELNKQVELYEGRFLASLPPNLRKQPKSNQQLLTVTPAAKPVEEAAKTETQEPNEEISETKPQTTGDEFSASPEEQERIKAELAKVQNTEFDYNNEISSNQSENIFGMISRTYVGIMRDQRIRTPKPETEEDRRLREEVKSDLKQILRKLD